MSSKPGFWKWLSSLIMGIGARMWNDGFGRGVPRRIKVRNAGILCLVAAYFDGLVLGVVVQPNPLVWGSSIATLFIFGVSALLYWQYMEGVK